MSLFHTSDPARPRCDRRGDGGQATAEYVLVLLAAAAIALALTRWAVQSGAIGDLFDAVMAKIRHELS